MRNSRRASSYVPQVYAGFKEMEQIMRAHDDSIDVAEAALNELIDNQWLSTAKESGVSAYERVLGIVPDLDTEDLEFRRSRLINRFSSRIPFTLPALKRRLDAIIGVDKYSINVDHNNYTIYLESSSVNQIWYTETMLTISGMKPCNMVFINKPLLKSGVTMSHEISCAAWLANYTLGEGFKLGMAPFMKLGTEGVIKMASSQSFTDKFINDIATFTANEIAFISLDFIDGTSSFVFDFSIKSVENNLITIEYDVEPDTRSAISRIELYNMASERLAASYVYIPTSDKIRLKHTILVKEG